MKGKALNIIYGIPAVVAAAAFYYFLCINPPRWLYQLFGAAMIIFFLWVLCVLAFMKLKEWFKEMVKKIVKEVLEGE